MISYLFIYLFIYLFVGLFVYFFIYLLVCLFVLFVNYNSHETGSGEVHIRNFWPATVRP